jgi:hypothetical protein
MGRMHIPLGALALVTAALFMTADAQAQKVRIVLTSVTTVATIDDTIPKGTLNKGDSITFKDLLRNRAAQFGKKVGAPVAYDSGTITYTNPKQRKVVCTASFPGIGTITYTGIFKTLKDGSAVFPITGGTGGFKGATGTVTIGPGTATAANIYAVNVPHYLDIHSTGVA